MRRPASAEERLTWWTGVLFAVGATCFLVAPLPLFLHWVGPELDGLVFFVGSLFFTTAATLQWWGTAVPLQWWGARGPRDRAARLNWWASGVQWVGTLFFNVTTAHALTTALSSPAYDQAVWRPDAFGSVCFLVSGWLAYVAVGGGWRHRPPRTRDAVIAEVNLLGCIAFGVSALASYVLPGSGVLAAPRITNVTTSLGALGFLVGALLLLPREPRRTLTPGLQDEGPPIR